MHTQILAFGLITIKTDQIRHKGKIYKTTHVLKSTPLWLITSLWDYRIKEMQESKGHPSALRQNQLNLDFELVTSGIPLKGQ